MNLMPYKIPPGPPVGKGGALESPPLSKGDLGGFLSNDPLIQQHWVNPALYDVYPVKEGF